MPAIFLTAEWRSLVMLNYTVDPGILRSRLPRGVDLDLWRGEAVVSVVGFQFRDCRVFGIPVPGHRDFVEVNLRYYVLRNVGGERRRGVVFVREIVPRAAIAITARVFYNEPYLAMPMRRSIDGSRLEYAWRHRGVWQRLSATTRGGAEPIAAGTEEEFIFEHYWGYSRQRDGGTVEYQVEHPPWRVWQVGTSSLEGDVAALYGGEFVAPLAEEPRSAFVAEGSPVCVRRGVRIT